jgi:carbon-monoxide dehydrogenase medium subunit
MKGFEYIASTTLEEATAVLAEHGDGARILAGGTDILVQLREGQRAADVVLDIKKVPELTEVTFPDGGGLRLGAAVPFHRIWGDERIIDAYPALTDASRIVGGWQIQGRASVGGNLCNSSPAADTTPALIVEAAECHIAGPTGRRSVPAAEFCTGPGRNVLERGELLVSLEFPARVRGAGSRYVRFIPRNEMDIAVAGAGVWLELDEPGDSIVGARIALAAVAPTAVEATEAAAWLLGRPATSASFERAGELARSVADPISDMRGPAEYRVHLVGVLVKRALAVAADRARGGDRFPIIPTAA